MIEHAEMDRMGRSGATAQHAWQGEGVPVHPGGAVHRRNDEGVLRDHKPTKVVTENLIRVTAGFHDIEGRLAAALHRFSGEYGQEKQASTTGGPGGRVEASFMSSLLATANELECALKRISGLMDHLDTIV